MLNAIYYANHWVRCLLKALNDVTARGQLQRRPISRAVPPPMRSPPASLSAAGNDVSERLLVGSTFRAKPCIVVRLAP